MADQDDLATNMGDGVTSARAAKEKPNIAALLDSDPEPETDGDVLEPGKSGKRKVNNAEDDSKDELDALSDITDTSDLEHVAVNAHAEWTTYEDEQQGLVETLASFIQAVYQ